MESPDLTRLKVLVADDEPKLRALVAGCVRALGCETHEAKDGDEAWQIAQTRRLDLVVLDVMMPGMSGWEVCRRIKSGAKTARGSAPKVLMLTGIGEHLNEMTSPLFAADAWIDKPFDLGELRQKVVALGEESLSEVPAAAPSGPSLKKARPAAPFDDAQEAPAPESSPAEEPAPAQAPAKKAPNRKKKALGRKKKAPAKKAPGRKKKAPARKAPGRKKKAPARKAPGRKKKAPARKAPGRKKKAPARKAPGRKKKAPARKAPGRKKPPKKGPVRKKKRIRAPGKKRGPKARRGAR